VTGSPTPRFNIRLLAASLLFVAMVVAEFAYTGAVVKPPGPLWSGYLQQPRNTLDVVLFGNSHVFDGIDPMVFWQRKGITGYVMAGPIQQPKVTQDYVRECLRTQHPRVIIMDMSSMSYTQENYITAFQETNVGYMPWGVNKVHAALFETPARDRASMLVDLWPYHSRWSKLHFADLDLSRRVRPLDATMRGWTPLVKAREATQTKPSTATPSADKIAAVDANIPYLRAIAQTCRENHVALLLILTPTSPPSLYSWQLTRARAALERDYPEVRALDLSAVGAIPDLDWRRDFYDPGHITYTGSAKASATIAEFLVRTYGLPSHRADSKYAFWNRDSVLHDQILHKKVAAAAN
jgi:hypothetical protein